MYEFVSYEVAAGLIPRSPYEILLKGLRVSKLLPASQIDADEFLETSLDLGEHLVPNPAATFFLRDQTDGELLIVDRSLRPHTGHLVLCFLNNEFIVRRLSWDEGRAVLTAGGAPQRLRCVSGQDEFRIWGVVTFKIQRLSPQSGGAELLPDQKSFG